MDGNLPADGAATPCGLIAKSLFNDTFKITYYPTEADAKAGTNPTAMTDKISKADIAWESDVKYKFKNTEGDW